jgi:hypothetical protein
VEEHQLPQPPHVAELLAAFADDQVTPGERSMVAGHLAECEACSKDLADIRVGMQVVSTLPLMAAPDSIWRGIQAQQKQQATRNRTILYAALAIAASLLLVAGVTAMLSQRSSSPELRWEIAGSNPKPVEPGQWIETAARQQTTIKIGAIGFVDIDPLSRVRMVRTSSTQQRLALAEGGIHVKVTAPPRLFQVETAAGTAVDLGCEYDLVCDRNGNGLLRVTQGWVSYEVNGRESLVPAGASCTTRAGKAPGTPAFVDASSAFTTALATFDDGNLSNALDSLLQSARARDTLTLWHLLSRVGDAAARVRVLDRMTSFAPLPAGVTREGVLALDPDILRRWREELAWTW